MSKNKQINKRIKAEVGAKYESLLDERFELLFSDKGGPRLFFMDNPSLKTVIGILVSETDDSFLVAMPARLIEDGSGYKEIKPFVPVHYIRLQKSSVTFVSYIFEPFDSIYKEYVESAESIYPDAPIDLAYFLENWKDSVKDKGLDEDSRLYSESRG